jgi:hypothetical protein
MGNFAVLDENNKVTNIIVADSKEIAEEVTGLPCVEYTDSNPAIIGLGYADGVFEQLPIPEPVQNEETETVPE